MNIVVLRGSPTSDGPCAQMVKSFVRGAQDAGHVWGVFNLNVMKIHPCTGCLACGHDDRCVQHDKMGSVIFKMVPADMVVFATPLTYGGMTAQLKAVLDRFRCIDKLITSKHMRAALLAVADESEEGTFDALVAHYRSIVRQLNMIDEGMVLGYGCTSTEVTEKTGILDGCYLFGRNLR